MIIKARRGERVVLLLLSLLLLGGIVSSGDRKMRVILASAAIHLNPDEKSPILEVVEKGTILGLLSPGKFKGSWYYVSLKSSSGTTKSGYIQETAVEPLFQAQKIITIKGEDPSFTSVSPLIHLEPGLWGTSREKIISLEGEPEERRGEENIEVLEYRRDLRDYEARLEYIFCENRLIQVRLDLWQVAGEKNSAIRTFEQIKDYLKEKFGPPLEDIINWENPTFKDDELSWGYAVSLGHLNYRTRWISSNLELFLQLKGENRSIWLEFEGTQAEFKELAKKVSRDPSSPAHPLGQKQQ